MQSPEQLIKVVKGVVFYRDNNDHDKFYAEFTNCFGKTEFISLDSTGFEAFLYNESCDDTEYDEVIEPHSAVKNLRWIILYNRNFQYTDVFIRTSGTLQDFLEYDLQRESQKAVKITREGWCLAPKTRKFVSNNTNLPQVKPQKTNKSLLKMLKRFVNIRGDTYKLFVVWLVHAFIRGNHYALLIFAERGSGKSTLSKMIKKIVDPCSFEVTPIPEKIDDIRVLLNSTLLCCFDNVSHIKHEVSDLFCGSITETNTVKRSLYTNSEVNVSTLHNILVINGIGVVPERDDLAERMLILKLKKLNPTNTQLEGNIWKEFDELLPEILGAIFNTLSKAMVEIDTIDVKDVPRMADAFIEMLAIAKALGISEEEFRKIHDNNKLELEQARLGSPIVTAVKEYMDTVLGRSVTGTVQEIYAAIFNNFSGDKTLLPSSASHFSRALDNEHANLLKAGFRANIDDTGAKGTQLTLIKKK